MQASPNKFSRILSTRDKLNIIALSTQPVGTTATLQPLMKFPGPRSRPSPLSATGVKAEKNKANY